MYEVVVLEEKTVAVISARTNNGDTNVQAVIGGLRGSFIVSFYLHFPLRLLRYGKE